jgi:hypothetical protein
MERKGRLIGIWMLSLKRPVYSLTKSAVRVDGWCVRRLETGELSCCGFGLSESVGVMFGFQIHILDASRRFSSMAGR